MSIPPFSQWSFEIGSFMVLLGDQEEISYRLMRRHTLECFVAVPVAGLQSYLHPADKYIYNNDLVHYEYTSPYGGKTAPLRNMRLAKLIDSNEVLKTQEMCTYRLKKKGSSEVRKDKQSLQMQIAIWVAMTWVFLVSCLIWIFTLNPSGQTTWIGASSCTLLVVWSALLRLGEKYFLVPEPLNTSKPENNDAVIFLGRRSSAFVLEGTREQIAKWTGRGLQVKSKIGTRDRNPGSGASICDWFDWDYSKVWEYCSRLGTALLILYIFVTVPNGTPHDQLAFIALNIAGQLNVLIGQKLNSRRYRVQMGIPEGRISSLECTKTRTHVLGNLIRRYTAEKEVGIQKDWTKLLNIPDTPVWREWSSQVLNNESEDAKELYNRIEEAHSKAQKAEAVIIKGSGSRSE